MSLFISITGIPFSFNPSINAWISFTLFSNLWFNLSFSCWIKASFSIKSGSGLFHISSNSSGVNSTWISSKVGNVFLGFSSFFSSPSSPPSSPWFSLFSFSASASNSAFNSSNFSCFFCLINSSSLCFLLSLLSFNIFSYIASISSIWKWRSIIDFILTLKNTITLGTLLDSYNKSINGVGTFSSKLNHDAS